MSDSLITSIIISLITFIVFFSLQWTFFKRTQRNIDIFKRFFKKKGEYETIDIEDETLESKRKGQTSKILKNVATSDAELHYLIEDINEYLLSCKGTATFSIIQNKTERRVTNLYEYAASKASFPTYFGLMGTFVGVFLGLLAFLLMSYNSKEGITDDAIHSLIAGVLVSMSTSFVGLAMSTRVNYFISDAKDDNDDDKNEFYEYIQNKLMPSVDLSLTEALGNLHQTVSEFEPSFSHVISDFRKAFQDCTIAFGADFRKSVKTMVDAVGTMSSNINEITQNVDLLQDLLTRLSGAEWIRYMQQFANASDHFKELTQSLNDFERARRMMLAAVQEAINIQKTYNESLSIPREVAIEINTILNRVSNFEKNINALGENLAMTQMLGDKEIKEIENQISAIKVKHKVAEHYIETSNNKLEMFFDSQLIELKRLENKYQEALNNLYESYEKITEGHTIEIKRRNELFKDAIDEKFELSGVRSELMELKKLANIDSKVEEVKKGQDKLQRTNEGIRSELNAFNAAKEEEKKGAVARIFDTSNSAKDREIEQRKREIENLQKQLEKLQDENIKLQQSIIEPPKPINMSDQISKDSEDSVVTPPQIEESPNKEEVSTNFIGRLFGWNRK